MSRSGYSDDCEQGTLNLYRANMDRSLSSKRGQAFLREMASALDAMPVKELVAEELVTSDGNVCAMGAVAIARGLDMVAVDPTDAEEVARRFGISRIMACEIAYMNDGDHDWARLKVTPAERWVAMRSWVAKQIANR